jgi:hypothetical protein
MLLCCQSAMSVLSDSRVKAQLASIVPTVPDGVRSTKADHVISLSSFDLHLIDGVANLDYMFDNGILKDVKCQYDVTFDAFDCRSES